MQKAAFINLQDKYSLYSIVETQTYEPVFLDWSDEILHQLCDFGCVVYYSSEVDTEIIKLIRKHLNFLNSRLLVYTDSLNLEKKKELLFAGADMVDLLPEREGELLHSLRILHSYSKNEKMFQKDLLVPFRQTIEDIFSTMVLLPIEFVDAYLSTMQFHYGDITGIMSLASENKGAILVTFYEGLARKIISNIMAIPIANINEDIERDGVGELVNMIAGGTKSKLSYSDAHFFLTTPTVITGSKHRIIQNKDLPNVVIVYKLGDEYFAVQVCLAAWALKY